MAIIAHFSYKCKLLIVLIIGYMHLNFLVTHILIFLVLNCWFSQTSSNFDAHQNELTKLFENSDTAEKFVGIFVGIS